MEALKWIGIVVAAGFVGYFGRYLAMKIIDRLEHRYKAPPSPKAPEPVSPKAPEPAAPPPAAPAAGTDAKLAKKQAKSAAKAAKKAPPTEH